MSTFAAETTIARSPGDIWAYAADILRHPPEPDRGPCRRGRDRLTDVGSSDP